MKPDVAFTALQKQELAHKFVEIGKVLLTWAILKNVDMVIFKNMYPISSIDTAVCRLFRGWCSFMRNL